MKQVRLVLVVFVTICAFGATWVTYANAAEPPASFTYSGSGAFTLTGQELDWETSGKFRMSCTGSNGTGQFGKRAATTAELTITFTGCEASGFACKSAGLPIGNLQTVKLAATLGRIGEGQAGLLLKPKAGTAFFVPATCNGEGELTWSGSAIGKLTPVDTQSKTLRLAFTQTQGLQTIQKFEGATTSNNLVAKILADGPEQMGLSLEPQLTLKEGSGQLVA
jgi:hypothetical protein